MPFEEDQAIFETQSLCPECLRRIPAIRFLRGNDLFMQKICPDHGRFEAILWRGEPSCDGWSWPKTPSYPAEPVTSVRDGCPFDCGLCPEHRQQTCTALLEVTQRCNLRCAFCFADSNSGLYTDPDMKKIKNWFEVLKTYSKWSNVQLSGGEPTMRDDLPEIVELGRSMGFGFIQLNSNGIRLGNDTSYVSRLKKSGLSSVFLQFDGLREDIYTKLRGENCLNIKLQALDNLRSCEIGVVLVPTIVPGVNDSDLGSIVEFALDNLDVVRGVHFQPVSFFGRHPSIPSDQDRITIPEIIRGLEAQTRGLLKIEHFKPPCCENPFCSFNGNFVLMPDSTLVPLTRRPSPGDPECLTPSAAEGASRARKFVAENWGNKGNSVCPETSGIPMGNWDILWERTVTHKLCISGMAFQDIWNIDLDRLRDCCIHVISPDGRLIPFCAYNVTSVGGRSLYRRGC